MFDNEIYELIIPIRTGNMFLIVISNTYMYGMTMTPTVNYNVC